MQICIISCKMKKGVQNIIICLISLGVIILLNKYNVNTPASSIQYIQKKIADCEINIIEENKDADDILYIDNTIITTNKLYNWGINDIQEIYYKNFIINNTGWYWVLYTKNKICVLKFKSLYPVNNQYLQEHYAECLNISNDYKLEYSENACQFKNIKNNCLPITLSHYPKYKNNILLNISAILYSLWWIFLFHSMSQLYHNKWWWLISFIIVMFLRWIFTKWDIISLNESILYDIKAYAFPSIYFLKSIGDLYITVILYAVLAYKLKSKNSFFSYLDITITLVLLFTYIYLLTHHTSFTLNVTDVLFYNYNSWIYTTIALIIILYLIVHAAIQIVKTLFSKHSFYQYGIIFLIVLSTSVYLIFHYQNTNLKNKIESIFDWTENEGVLFLFEQIHIIDKSLSKINNLNDSMYFKNISDIENSSIYLQLSKRYLFEDSLSLNNYLSNKRKIQHNIYIDDSGVLNTDKTTTINKIYYVNSVNKKYLVSEFDYFLPFSDKSYYSFLSDKIFQLPSGFKDFNISYYEHQKQKFKIGDVVFPSELLNTALLKNTYPEYIYTDKKIDEKTIVILHRQLSISDFVSIFSTYFILFLTILLIVFYIYYSWKFKNLFPINHLSYFYKITGLVVFTLLISFYLLFIISYRYVHQLLNDEIKKQLLKDSQTFKIENSDNKDVLIYHKNGNIHERSVSNTLIRFKLLPSYLPSEWIKNILTQQLFFVKRQIGSYQYTSLFRLWNNSYIVEFSYFDESAFIEKNLKTLLNPLFNIYALLFFISFILGIILSNYVVSPIRNITRQLQNPLDLKTIPYNAKDELGNLVKNYNTLVYKLNDVLQQLSKEQQEKAWKLMAQQIAHDIKNSLTPLLLNIEYLKRQKTDSNINETIINSISQQIQILSRIAEDFSEFAQDIQVKSQNVNLKNLIENIIAHYQIYKNIKITTIIPSDVPTIIYTDPYLLSRVLMNLVKNSIDAIEKDGEIIIKLQKDNYSLIISISDNGCGIPEEIKDKIFEPKFSTKNSGKGLGLPIVKNICDKLSIQIDFITELNKGTTFYLRIPL